MVVPTETYLLAPPVPHPAASPSFLIRRVTPLLSSRPVPPYLQAPRMHEVAAADFIAAEPDVLRCSAADLVKLWNE